MEFPIYGKKEKSAAHLWKKCHPPIRNVHLGIRKSATHLSETCTWGFAKVNGTVSQMAPFPRQVTDEAHYGDNPKAGYVGRLAIFQPSFRELHSARRLIGHRLSI